MPSPVAVARLIAAPADDVWAVMSAPGHLADWHPFVAGNVVHAWPGIGARDTIVYHNGRVIERSFTGWLPGTGFDLEASDANGPAGSVSWRLAPTATGAKLTIAYTPVVRNVLGVLAVRVMMRRYLRAVLAGIDHRVTTGLLVRRNQFGSHPWFSPAVRGAKMTKAHKGFFPIVRGEEVHVQQAGGIVYAARGDLSLTQGGGSMLIAGGDLSIREGGGNILACGGNLSVHQGGGAIAAAPSIELRQSYVGVALGASISVEEGSRVLLGTREAAVAGLAAGLGCFLLSRLLGR